MRSLWLAATACVIGFSVEASLAQNRDRLVVRTETGPVRGVHNGAVDAFLGIPYSAPPRPQLQRGEADAGRLGRCGAGQQKLVIGAGL
jgi:para-nitrobenzyl esterase